MTSEEGIQYWIPARKIMSYKDSKFGGSSQLATLLGLAYPDLDFWREIPLTDELKHKLQAIAGPYSHTVIKMLEARNGK